MGGDTTRLWWPKDRIDRLKELVAAGCTGSQAAEELGLSRNAVIAKAHRIGHPFHSGFKATPASEDLPPVPERKANKPALPVRPDPAHPNRCATRGCRGVRQQNRYCLCAECNHKRIKDMPRANDTHEVVATLEAHYG